MDLLQMILIILVVVIVAAVGYYIYTIMSFRKLILFESELKKHPSDEKVKEYMQRYAHTFVPKNPQVLESRAKVYRVIKQSDAVSYETKKALREFLEKRNVNTLTTSKQAKERLEDMKELSESDE